MPILRASLIAIVLSISTSTSPRAEISVAKGDDKELQIGGMSQLLGFAQRVNDPSADDNRLYLFLKAARLRMSGHYDQYRFHLEMALGGEAAVVAPSPGVSLSLLDMSFDIPIASSKTTYLRVGQFKVPYGRERLTYSANLQFNERSIQDLGFRVGRDVGIAVVSRPGLLTLMGGVFTGGGRDVPPQRYLPQKLGVPMMVARVGIGNVDDDPFVLSQTDFEDQTTKAAFFVNGLYTHDSLVGHSSALNVKLADKSLLLDSTWNPFIADPPLSQGEWWQVGADAAVRVPMGRYVVTGEVEANYAGFSNDSGQMRISGGRVQAGARRGQMEFALRHAVLFPSEAFSNGGVAITGTQAIQELTPSLTYYFKGQMMKLVVDAPFLINAPVFIEPKVGAYVGTELPGQSTLLAKGGKVERQNVIEGRLMLQAQF